MEANQPPTTAPPTLRIMRMKTVGSKLHGNALYDKVAIMPGIALPFDNHLACRTNFWFVVAEPDLFVRVFTVGINFAMTDLTQTNYLIDFQHHANAYTMFCINLKTKSTPVIVVWYNAAREIVYHALYYANMLPANVPQNLPLDDLLQQIADKLVHLATLNNNNNNVPNTTEQQLLDQTPPDIDVIDDWSRVMAYHQVMHTAVRPVVGVPVPYENGQPRYRVVHIVAEELARKWTWKAEVLGLGIQIKFKEQYMRGGQACNSVITRCKQEVYNALPGELIVFRVELLPRRKDLLKVKGQNFLNAVFSSWFPSPATAITSQTTNNTNDTNESNNNMLIEGYEEDLRQQVPNNDIVVITVFPLTYPITPQDACWIALVCDDDKRLAFELRSQGVDTNALDQLIEDMKQCVAIRLQQIDYGHIEFQLVVRENKMDRLREWAHSWLDGTIARAHLFARWATSFINGFNN